MRSLALWLTSTLGIYFSIMILIFVLSKGRAEVNQIVNIVIGICSCLFANKLIENEKQ